MAPTGNQKGKRMWPSLPAANHVADVANWFFIGSLVVGVVSSILIVWMAGVKEGYWEKDRAESAERIASLRVQGDQLRKDTAEANASALKSALALEEFKAPRILSPKKQAELTDKMKSYAGQEYAFAISPTIDALPLMEQIDAALGAAGWVKVGPLGAIVVAGAAVAYFHSAGVRVQVANSKIDDFGPLAILLAQTLTDAGVVAASAMSPDVEVRPTAIQIVIGIKPK
jgi:hypothetical protein